jgi:hypothetical protein
MDRLSNQLIIAIILLVFAVSACNKNYTTDDTVHPLEEGPITAQQQEEDLSADDLLNGDVITMPTYTDENGFAWRVLPEFEYEQITFCIECGSVFGTGHSGVAIDPVTCQIIAPWRTGHGIDWTDYLYDEIKNLYGYYDHGECGEYFDMYTSDMFPYEGIIAFQKIDSDKVTEEEGADGWGPHYSIAKLSDKYAIAYDTKFVSDFIYDVDDIYGYCFAFRVKDIIAVQLDNYWGVIDKDGNTAVPFKFDHIFLIDEESAFAKYDGKYGILDVYGKSSYTIPKPESTDESAAFPEKNFITTENVNLRAGASADSLRFTTVPKGTAVKVIDYENAGFWQYDWYWVDYNGQKGYMKADYLVPGPTPEPDVDFITINGVDYSTSMTGLTLNSDYLLVDGDIDSLKNMTKLTSLYLYGEFRYLSGLGDLTDLTELVIYGRYVRDLRPLNCLTNLTELRIYVDSISDLTPLARLKKLTTLALSSDQINDLSPLSGLTNLKSFTLTVQRSPVNDWSPVEHVPNVSGYWGSQLVYEHVIQ